MVSKIFCALVLILILIGCESNNDQKIMICQEAMSLIQEECNRINDERFVKLCHDGVSAATTSCTAGVDKNPALMCKEISNMDSACDVIPDINAADVATCKSVLHGASIACMLLQ